MSITTYNGVVKWFNAQKGFGFIAPDEAGADVFLHISDLEKSGLSAPIDGQRVNYELREHKGKTSAVNITFRTE